MKTDSKNQALVLVNTPEWAVAGDEVKHLQDLAVEQLGAISKMENAAAMGSIIAGLTLHRVKASMKHGTFGKWLDQIRTGGANLEKRPSGSFLEVTQRHAQRYMSLALHFLDECKVQLPELLALPGDQLTLDLADGHDHNDLLVKLRKFCGSCSLNELLIKHDIKSVGLKKELTAQKAGEEKAAGAAAAPPTPEELYEQSRDEVGSALLRLETLLIEENRLQYLAGHPELRGGVDSLKSLSKKVLKAARPLLKKTKTKSDRSA